MKIKNYQFGLLFLILLLTFQSATGKVRAQPPSNLPEIEQIPSNRQNNFQKIQDLDPQVVQQLQDQIQKNIESDINQDQFNALNTLIAGLGFALALITAIPVIAGLSLFFLRQSIIKVLSESVADEFSKETKKAKQEIEKTKKSLNETIESVNKIRSMFVLRQLIELIPEPTIKDLASSKENSKSLKNVEVSIEKLLHKFTELAPQGVTDLKTLLNYLNNVSEDDPQYFLRGIDYVKLGNLLYLNEKYREAISYYDKAIDINPLLYKAYNEKGLALRKLNEYEEALQQFHEAKEINPKNYHAWNNIGAIYLDQIKEVKEENKGTPKFQKLLKDAETYCTKAVELNPDSAIAYSNLGFVYGELNNFKKELDCYDKAIEIEPTLVVAWYNKACSYALQNDVSSVIKYLKEAIKINPQAKTWASEEQNFENIRNDKGFQDLIS